MAIATRLSARAMTTLGAMALITLCFQTFNSSNALYADARLDIINRQILTLRATINQILKEKDIKISPDISWPTGQTSDSNELVTVAKIVFALFATPGWISAMVQFYKEAGAVAERTVAVGIWLACAVFVGLWYLGQPREWYGYFLGATWGFYGGMFLSVLFAEENDGEGQKT